MPGHDQAAVTIDAELPVAMQANAGCPPRDADDRPGVVARTPTMAPKQDRRIRFDHTVTVPCDRPVQGRPGW